MSPTSPRKARSCPVAAEVAGGHILLAEDNEINQLVAQEILEDAGLVCDLAENGEVAVTMVRSAPAGTYA
jgi:CheY-like chemotaxis protein